MGDIRIQRLTGPALAARLPDLARLRIAVFRDFPYLYDGSQAYEERYLATYAGATGSVVVAAFDGDAVVGAATGVPLTNEPEVVTEPFRRLGYDVDRVFYFGESVLLRGYRGRGIGVAFFDEREAHARGFGRFTHAAFCGVVRPPDHPLRPKDYVPLDDFWRRRGFRPVPELGCSFSWKEIGDTAESSKPMRFWLKELVP